eukprot:675688-Rhodomonas_salina.1
MTRWEGGALGGGRSTPRVCSLPTCTSGMPTRLEPIPTPRPVCPSMLSCLRAQSSRRSAPATRGREHRHDRARRWV